MEKAGGRVWKQILKAIEEMERTERAAGEPLN